MAARAPSPRVKPLAPHQPARHASNRSPRQPARRATAEHAQRWRHGAHAARRASPCPRHAHAQP
eukprot:812817-Prymnesium_polylepis.1